MARRTFFSFHYKDVWRANIVRNSWVTKDNNEAAGFIDAAEFEKIEREGEGSIKRWIDRQLDGTSVTVVLIGAETSARPYVKYELEQSYKKGNGMLGIYIHDIKDKNQLTTAKGSNQFGSIGKNTAGNDVYFSIEYITYEWNGDKGYENLGAWIANAAAKAGR